MLGVGLGGLTDGFAEGRFELLDLVLDKLLPDGLGGLDLLGLTILAHMPLPISLPSG